MTVRLKPGFFVRALIRRVENAGAFAYVAKKGTEEAGAVFLKIDRLDGTCLVLGQARQGEGELVWAKLLGDTCDAAAADAYLDKQRRFDPDAWVVEIEDREGRAFVDEKVV